MWDYFDKIYVITVKGSKRIQLIKKHFTEIGLMPYTEICEFNKIKNCNQANNGGEINSLVDMASLNLNCDATCKSIANNHLFLVKTAYLNGFKNVLIFEDDAEFELPFPTEKIKRVINWLKTHDYWDIFYFGYLSWPRVWATFVSYNVTSISSPICGHSYALNRSGMKKIIQHIDPTNHFDIAISKISIKKYGVFPQVCFQSIDPAYYRLFQKKTGLKISFKTMCKIMEKISVVIPFLVLTIVLYTVLYITRKIKNRFQKSNLLSYNTLEKPNLTFLS